MNRDNRRDYERATGLMKAALHLAESGAESARKLAQEALSISDDPHTLVVYLQLAVALFDVDMIKDASARAALHADISPSISAQLGDVKQGPLTAIRFAERLTARHPLSINPLPGRILYILHKSLPDASDGYATRSHGLARAMLKLGADLVCYTRPGFPYDLRGDAELLCRTEESVTVDEVIYHRLTSPKRSDFPPPQSIHLLNASFGYLEAATNRLVAVMHQHRPSCVMAASNFATALPACLAARRLGLPFIYEVRGFWELSQETRTPGFLNTTTGRQETFLENRLARSADCVITLTSPMMRELVARGVAEPKISIAPNACDPKLFQPITRDTRLAARLSLSDDVPVVGYAGSFNPYEGLIELIEACARLRKQGAVFRLILVGSEPPDERGGFLLTEQIKRTSEEAGLREWLIMPGRVAHDEVAQWYSLIDVAPFPRKSLPVTELVSPLKPLEAMAMGKAVVVSSVGGLREMVRDGDTGIVFEKGDGQALENALKKLLYDEELRRRLGHAARAWVHSERTWEKSAEKLTKAADLDAL